MATALSCVICHDCNQSQRFFHVPNNTDRLQKWSNLLSLEINSSSIVCEKHFLKKHISRNSDLNCYRLNKKAIPTLQLTDEDVGDIKLINENLFDNELDIKHSGDAQDATKNSPTPILMECLWCDNFFETPDLYEILKHLKSKHHYEIVTFFEFEDEIVASNTSYNEIEEDSIEAHEIIEESCDFDEIDMETNTTNVSNESSSLKFSHNDHDDDDDEIDSFKIEQCNLKNGLIVKLNPTDDNNTDILESYTDKLKSEPSGNVLLNGEEGDNQIDIETSEHSIIFFIIELLHTIPTIWFINCFKSKEFEAGLKKFGQQFSEHYQFDMTEIQLHECLIRIQDWYAKIYEEKTFDQLSYPQSEYFWSLAAFLPDKPNGKTCELCGILFHDHIQYFGHKKMKHANASTDDNNQESDQVTLEFLKKHSHDYFYARYPHYQGGFSYQCQNCPRVVKKNNKIVFFEHIKTHLDIRDHICDICGKSFIKADRFAVHRKRHLGTYKFECQICKGKEFTNFSLLTAHRNRYHRPIEGTIEEIELLHKRYSKRDWNRASGINVSYAENDVKIYSCRVCDKTYKHRSGIFKHRRLFHPDIIPRKYKTKKSKIVEVETEEIFVDTEIII